MSPGVVNSFVSKRPQCCRTWAQSSCRAQLRRGTAVHKAKFARRLQLKIGLCRLSPIILATFAMQIKSPLEFKSHFICCRRPWLLDEIPRAIGTCAMLCGPIAHLRSHAIRLVVDVAPKGFQTRSRAIRRARPCRGSSSGAVLWLAPMFACGSKTKRL
jgi:hypothetical protein